MDDLISKQDALDAIARIGLLKSDTKEVQAVAECLRKVEKLQPIKQETVTEFADRCRECGKMRTGHWITENRLYPKCDQLVIDIPEDVYTRLFDNGIQDNEIAVDDVCEMARALRLGKPLPRCKECKYFEYDSVAKVDGIPLIVAHEICNKWGDGCKTKEDGYCFLFEPQESEE